MDRGKYLPMKDKLALEGGAWSVMLLAERSKVEDANMRKSYFCGNSAACGPIYFKYA